MNTIHMGVGGFGHHWSKVLTQTDTVTVTALVDSSQDALDQTCAEFDYDPKLCFTSLDDALAQVEADILLCVTPPKVFRSGATWRRGQGRIFYFRPGHETYPIYYQPEVLQVIANGIRWATFRGNTAVTGIGDAPNMKTPLETIGRKS